MQYEYRGASRELIYCKEREVLFAGPRGTSKSITAQSKIVMHCADWPRSRHLLARKVRRDANQTTLETFEREVLGPGHPALLPKRERSHRELYTIGNSEVIIGGFEDPEQYKGAKFDTITFEEATEFDDKDHETALGCLRNFAGAYHQFVAVTNPGGPKHRLIERARSGRMHHLVSRHEDNPAYFNADGTKTVQGTDYISTLDAMSGANLKRMRHGLWAAAEGQVFDEWDDDLHLRTLAQLGHPDGLPESWKRIRSVDFGHTHPMAVQWWAFDGDGRAYLYRQFQETGRLVEDVAKEILDLSGSEKIATTVCDYEDAEGMATLARHKVRPVIRANKDVESGIQCVKSRLRKAKDGRARLYVLRGSLVRIDPALRARNVPYSFETEVGGYVWDQKRDGDLKEQPLKHQDDAMDACRYAMRWAEVALNRGSMRAIWVT